MHENCTIGAIYTHSGLMIFKNRDLLMLPSATSLPEPAIGIGQVPYIGFGTGKSGVWAGINGYGLGIVGADGNGASDLIGQGYGDGSLTWEAYEYVLANFKSVKQAFPWLISFYEQHRIGGAGDIVLLADMSEALIAEYARPGIWGLHFCRPEFASEHHPPYLVRTNFFITLAQYRPQKETSPVHLSSEARYKSAVSHLARIGPKASISDVVSLLRSHNYGLTPFSNCRHSSDHEYNTVASAILVAGSDGIFADYVLNAHPCEKEYSILPLGPLLQEEINAEEMKSRIGVSPEEEKELAKYKNLMESEVFERLRDNRLS